MLIVAIIAGLVLAFANGANDNVKGVATLIGGKVMKQRHAIGFAAITTFCGSVAALFLAQGLISKFSGKGLVDVSLISSPAFLCSVGLAAALTVLVATRIGMPISTTHALVGGITGVGLSAHALHTGKIIDAFFIPLLIAPLLALALAAMVYPLFRWTRLKLGITRQTCICIGQEYHPVTVTPEGALLSNCESLKVMSDHSLSDCCERYDGQVAGIDAQRILDASHIFTAGAISFARGLNDTPKIAAILLGVSMFSPAGGLVFIGVGIAIGGLLAARRVANTMSYRITDMNDGQAFTGNLITAFCVIVASRFGIPVSTTHVSCGSLFGIGLANRKAHYGVIGQILLAWVTTLPVAAGLGWLLWKCLS